MADQIIRGSSESLGEVVRRGEIICPGIAIGPAFLLEPEFLVTKKHIPFDQVGVEQNRYTEALRLVQTQFAERVREIRDATLPEAAAIFSAFEAMLSDREFTKSVLGSIAGESVNAEWALEYEAEKLIRLFDAMADPYLQARAEDVRELVDGILRALARAREAQVARYVAPEKGQVLVSDHLFPRAAMQAQHAGAAAFATESSALFAHAAILLKGFRIPSVGGIGGLGCVVFEGDDIIVNANEATVVVRPTPETVKEHLARLGEARLPLEVRSEKGWTTRDGTQVHLMANIESPDQLDFAYLSGLEGVGLFRTEFLALTSGSIPSEEEQYEVYQEIVQASSGKRICIRTFDIGADKQNRTLYRNVALNPAMGTRGIRRHLNANLSEFKTQVRAILRAAGRGDADVGILLPVVTTIDEVRLARQYIEDVKKEMSVSGAPYSSDTKLGVMIEIPAAAIAMREMLAEADFVSVGTNDLLQHFMAADRDNEEVLKYNNFEHPAFLWLMRHMIDEATGVGRVKDVTVCGEAASRADLVLTMLRLGYRAFSIAPVALTGVRHAIETLDLRTEET
ncbi:MAG TPA: phosphoenolpyruvate--protein phosphotransferase [Candidatus Hydrogenedentes bacterium]|nr:phosphoenolpyruvate--protein phosphotransferase [Candidatus Hydrogenedentota bacterium]